MVQKVTAAMVAADVATQAELDAEAVLRALKLSGDVVQTVGTQSGALATGTTIMPADDTIPQITEGNEYLTRTITPTSAANTLVITVSLSLSTSGIGHVVAGLFQDSTAGALAAAAQLPQSAAQMIQLTFVHRMTAGTTSLTTFRVRAGGTAAGTTTFNGFAGGRFLGGVAASSITITEIKA